MPEPGETVVDCSRDSGSPLGNPYPARYEKDLDTCIQKFERVFWSDMQRRGIMWRAVRELAVRVAAGERIAMRCWCAPKRCHLDTVCAEVNKMADAIREQNDGRIEATAPPTGAARTHGQPARIETQAPLARPASRICPPRRACRNTGAEPRS